MVGIAGLLNAPLIRELELNVVCNSGGSTIGACVRIPISEAKRTRPRGEPAFRR